MNITRPMLAATIEDVNDLRFPLWSTPKIDGIRCLVPNNVALSRTFKPIPNKYIRSVVSQFRGFDGELVSGSTFQSSSSVVMSHEGRPLFRYMVFDYFGGAPESTYAQRIEQLIDITSDVRMRSYQCLQMLIPTPITNLLELQTYEQNALEAGYEGIILRKADSLYKSGRSTFAEHGMLKLKRFLDAEAIVIGFEELMHNDNIATIDNFGLTERSSHQDNKIGMGMLGALVVRSPDAIDFRIGSGFTEIQRKQIWKHQKLYINKTVTYKFQPHGVKERPRHPIFKSFRHVMDL